MSTSGREEKKSKKTSSKDNKNGNRTNSRAKDAKTIDDLCPEGN